jgi:hypothetical protein
MISDSVMYADIGGDGCKQLHSDFYFEIPEPKYSGEYGFISFDRFGQVRVKSGFVWDGASGPTFDTIDTVCASLGHDVLYKLMGQRLLPVNDTKKLKGYKDFADKWFYDRLIKDGTLQFRAFAWFKAVQLFGVPSQSMDNIKRAPKPFVKEIELFNHPLIGRLA